MQHSDIGNDLLTIIEQNCEEDSKNWFYEKLGAIINNQSVREFYLTYSLCNIKFSGETLSGIQKSNGDFIKYLLQHGISHMQLARIALLIRVLEEDSEFFEEKAKNLIQVADKGELETFLRYLILLPNSQNFRNVAVEALRTNITAVFDAISQNNPYPSLFFNDHQWNQMFLKAAFMERDLGGILDIDTRANEDLARIISDYAHERWSASRKVDPEIWRPTTNFLQGRLLEDMKRLFESNDPDYRSAAALCCYHSNKEEARKLLNEYQDLLIDIENGTINWENFKN